MDEGSTTKIDKLLENFGCTCDNCLTVCYSSLQLFNEQPHSFSKDMRDMLVEYVIIRLFGKWERFLESIFIEYMLGEKSDNGQYPTRYVFPNDAEHAYKLIQNVNLYPDWSDVDKVLINAQNFFMDGGPFAILNTMRDELNALKKIRNSIAHVSQRARKDFERLMQGKLGYTPGDITPATFLIDYKVGRNRSDPAYFEYYIQYLKNTAVILVEYTPRPL